MRVEEHTTTVDDVPVFYRSAGELPSGGATPLYLHEAITDSADWLPFLECTGGLAPDLIGFGRSGKGGHLDYSPEGITNFLVTLLAELGMQSLKLVGHGWGGALALLLALRDSSRVERIVLIDAVPLIAGFRWHRAARLWRRPVIGELVMGATSRRRLQRELRKATVRPDAWSETRLNAVWEEFDQGTQRALLRLHRAADESRLEQIGAGLSRLTSPVLVVWGERDPWFPASPMLPTATFERIPDAGHWPWLDQPSVIELVSQFLGAG